MNACAEFDKLMLNTVLGIYSVRNKFFYLNIHNYVLTLHSTDTFVHFIDLFVYIRVVHTERIIH